MPHPRSAVIVLAVSGVLLAACGDAPTDPAEQAEATDPAEERDAEGAPEPEPTEPGETGVDQPQPDDTPRDDGTSRDGPSPEEEQLRVAERYAIKLAAEEHGVDVGAVSVVEAELVTWPDGSLGCPEEGETYTQALVDGYRIVVEVDGRQVQYHGAEEERPFRCDDPRPPAGER